MSHAAALNTLMPIAGWSAARAGEVEVTGDTDPILATPFRITETAVASLYQRSCTK
jgi:hypothetical protein